MPVPLPLDGYLVLLLEDDPLIGLAVTQTLQDAGARTIGPFTSADSAMAAIKTLNSDKVLHGGVLDIDLGNHTSEAVARQLQTMGVPFVFHSGNTEPEDQLTEYDAPFVAKPAAPETLVARLAERIVQHRSS